MSLKLTTDTGDTLIVGKEWDLDEELRITWEDHSELEVDFYLSVFQVRELRDVLTKKTWRKK